MRQGPQTTLKLKNNSYICTQGFFLQDDKSAQKSDEILEKEKFKQLQFN